MGKFIVFEGGEGAGKGQQISRVSDALEAEGLPFIQTREPGGNSGAEEIRNLLVTGKTDRWTPSTELLLFAAARAEHVQKTIIPALDKGLVVLCDRFVGSTIAYQGAGHGIPAEKILRLHREFCDATPDMAIVLDIDPVIGLQRAGNRIAQTGSDEHRFEDLDIEFHNRVRAGLVNHVDDYAASSAIIDASRTPEAVFGDVINAVFQALGRCPKPSAP